MTNKFNFSQIPLATLFFSTFLFSVAVLSQQGKKHYTLIGVNDDRENGGVVSFPFELNLDAKLTRFEASFPRRDNQDKVTCYTPTRTTWPIV